MPQALITDIDGTLLDSNALHAESWRRAFEHFGIETSFADCWKQIGKGGDKVIPVFVPESDRERLGKSLKQLRKEIFNRDYLPRVVPFGRSYELLVRVRETGMKLALATSSDKDDLPTYGKIIGGPKGIDHLVNEAASSTDAENSKPDPDIFIAALKKLGIEPGQAVALGDTPWDAQAAGKVGLSIVGLTSGGWKRSELIDAGCAEVWKDPADLLDNFKKSALGRR